MCADAARGGASASTSIETASWCAGTTSIGCVPAATAGSSGREQGRPRPEAEASFRAALALANRQSATSFELRAATSLARLLRERGTCTEARTVLADVYGWFTEGLETRDLRTARTLLAQIG